MSDLNHLIEKNDNLVHHIARKYMWTGINYEDLVQAGREGMLKAASKFDPSHGVKFTTYAYWWIRQHIQRVKTMDDTHLSLDKTVHGDSNTTHLDNTAGTDNVHKNVDTTDTDLINKVLATLTPREERAIRTINNLPKDDRVLNEMVNIFDVDINRVNSLKQRALNKL